jgi:hypothetical protein
LISLSFSLQLNISSDRDRSHGMAKWIDDEFERRKEMGRRDKVLKAKAPAFWDEFAGQLAEDAEEMKRKLQVVVTVEQPTDGWIKIEKASPLPKFLISLYLEADGNSIKNERGSKSERLTLTLNNHDEPCAIINNENASLEELSEHILKPIVIR